jgi:hypothetical protein
MQTLETTNPSNNIVVAVPLDRTKLDSVGLPSALMGLDWIMWIVTYVGMALKMFTLQ